MYLGHIQDISDREEIRVRQAGTSIKQLHCGQTGPTRETKQQCFRRPAAAKLEHANILIVTSLDKDLLSFTNGLNSSLS